MVGFTGNKRGVRVLVAVFVLAFIELSAGWCSRANAEEVLTAGFGIATAGSEDCFDSMLLTQSFGDHEWLGYLATHGDSDSCRKHPVDANFGVGVLKLAHRGRWTLGVGGGLRQHGDLVIGPDFPRPTVEVSRNYEPFRNDELQLVASLFIRFRLHKHVTADLLHNSTGGATQQNRGLNTIVISGRF